MGVAIRLRLVEEENLVRVGDQRPATIGARENPSTHEHDAVRGVRLLDSARRDVRATAEVVDADSQAVEQRPPALAPRRATRALAFLAAMPFRGWGRALAHDASLTGAADRNALGKPRQAVARGHAPTP